MATIPDKADITTAIMLMDKAEQYYDEAMNMPFDTHLESHYWGGYLSYWQGQKKYGVETDEWTQGWNDAEGDYKLLCEDS